MLLELHSHTLPLPPALQDFMRRRIARLVRPFLSKVVGIRAALDEVHGALAGCRRCILLLGLREVPGCVRVEAEAADSRCAVRHACHRASDLLSRRWPHLGEAPRLRHDEGLPSFVEPPIVVTFPDDRRLRRLLGSHGGWPGTAVDASHSALLDELDRAERVAPRDIGSNVVTMNSRVLFREGGSNVVREASLVYPGDGPSGPRRVSVLAPTGGALLGLAAGQSIDWPLPRGRHKSVQVLRVLYQPEAAGALHL